MKKFKIKHESAAEFIRIANNFPKEVDFVVSSDFKKEFIIDINKFVGYDVIEVKYHPKVEECESDKILVYNYTYKVEKYDDMHKKLILSDFKKTLE